MAPTGTTGEGISVAFRDRLALPEVFAKAGFDPARAIFGTGACAAHDTVELTKTALGAGFPNVLDLPPFYYKNPSDEGFYRAYSTLLEEVAADQI